MNLTVAAVAAVLLATPLAAQPIIIPLGRQQTPEAPPPPPSPAPIAPPQANPSPNSAEPAPPRPATGGSGDAQSAPETAPH